MPRLLGRVTMATDAEWLAEHNELVHAIPVQALMGVVILQQGPNAVLTMELSDAVRGSSEGTVHGGLLATFADVASAVSLYGTYDFGVELPVTTDMHVRYYRQPRAGPLRAEANVVHRGRRLLSSECVIFDAERRELVRSTATYMIVANGRQ
jgi:uncharacterized protein (TIGR00369 family)